MHNNQKVVVSIIFLATIAQFGLLTYTPVLPFLQSYFEVAPETIQLSITLYLMPFGLSTLVYGPLSDYFGRKPIILIGILIHLLGIIAVILSSNIFFFILGRSLQGLGAGATAIIARAIIRDYFEEKMVGMVAILVMIMSIAPAIAPAIGGYLFSLWGWRSVFYFLSLYNSVSLFYIIFFYAETNLKRKKYVLSINKCIKDYALLITDRRYQKNIFAILLSYSCQIVFLSIAPFVFQKLLALSVRQYGFLMLLPASGYFLGGVLVRKISKYYAIRRIILFSAILLTLNGIAWFILYNLKCFTVFFTIWPVVIGFFLISLIFTCATADFLKPFGHIAGTATALALTAQLLGSSIITYSIQEIFPDTPVPIALAFIVFGALIALTFSQNVIKEVESK